MIVNDHFIRERPRNRGKFSHLIQLHEKLYSNSM